MPRDAPVTSATFLLSLISFPPNVDHSTARPNRHVRFAYSALASFVLLAEFLSPSCYQGSERLGIPASRLAHRSDSTDSEARSCTAACRSRARAAESLAPPARTRP